MIELQINLKKYLPNRTSINFKMSFYQGFLFGSKYNVEKNLNWNLDNYKVNSKNIYVLEARENIMNSMLVSYSEFKDLFISGYMDKYYSFQNDLLILLFILLGMMVTFLVVSVYLVMNIKNSMLRIYQSIFDLSDGEIENRKESLSQLDEFIEKYKEENYFGNFMIFREKNNQVVNHNRKKRRVIDRGYCFELTWSFFSVILFFSIKVAVAILMMILLNINSDTSIWINLKAKDNYDMIHNQMVFFNGIKQRLVLGKESKVFNQPIDSFLEEFNEKMKATSKIVYDLSSTNTEYKIHENSYKYLEHLGNSSLCGFAVSLKKYPKYCDLEDGIPKKGLVPTYLRVMQFMDRIMELKKSEDFQPQKILNDPEFIEFEFALEHVYIKAFMDIGDEFIYYTDKFLLEETGREMNLILFGVSFFILFSFWLIWRSLMRINKKVNIVVFSFKVLGIENVMENTALKFRFLNIFGVSERRF